MENDGVLNGCCGAENAESVKWQLEDGKLTITGDGAIADIDILEDPKWLQYDVDIESIEVGDGITGIGDRAFRRCKSATEIYLPEGLEYIGEEAFYGCMCVVNIAVPSTVRRIGSKAFRSCRRLLSVTLPEELTDVANDAFDKAPCASKIAGLTYVGAHLIAADMSLKDNIDIREGTVVVTDCTFNDCSGVTSITLPQSLKRIGKDALLCGRKLFNLRAETGNACFKSVKGVLFSADMTRLIGYPSASGSESYCAPDGVKEICDKAFYYTKNLKTLVLPEGVETLGDYAISECDKLEKIVLPASLKTVGTGAISECDSLETVEYRGSADDWDKVALSDENDLLEVVEFITA